MNVLERWTLAKFAQANRVEQWSDEGITYQIRYHGYLFFWLRSTCVECGLLLAWRCFSRGCQSSFRHQTIGAYLMSFVKKSKERREKLTSGKPATDAGFAKKYPALHEFLTLTSDGDRVRTTASLTLFADGHVFKVFVNDRDSSESFCASAETIEDCLICAERNITEGTAEWRSYANKRRK